MKTTRLESASILNRYWKNYGGFDALIKSTYLWFAVVVTGITFCFWSKPGWWDVPLSVMPNLLVFAVGGLAILLGVIDVNTFRILSMRDKDEASSIMSTLTASFTHFVLVQSMALFLSVICRAFIGVCDDRDMVLSNAEIIVSGITWLIFLYALTLTFATAIEIFRFSEMLQEIARFGTKDPDGTDHSSQI